MTNIVNDRHADYIVQQLRAGKGVQVETDPDNGRITGMTGIESGSDFARWTAERAERRASTRNV